MVNSSYTYSVFGITFSSFALAGLVYWSPIFLTVAKRLTGAQAEVPLAITFLGAAIIAVSPWRTVFWIGAAIGVVCSALLFLIPETHVAATRKANRQPGGALALIVVGLPGAWPVLAPRSV